MMKRITGISASRGICIGPVFQFVRQELNIEKKENVNPKIELERLQNALSTAKDQIEKIYQKALKESSDADAEIFQAHEMILDDPELQDEVKKKIKSEGKSAEQAMRETGQEFFDKMAAMNDEYFAARATDIMDVQNRVLRILLGIAESPTEALKKPSVIVANDLTPSDTVMLDKSLVIGFCTARGSATSHTAILARGLGIPAVSGAGEEVLKQKDGTEVILDGTRGVVIFAPEQDVVAAYRKRINTLNTIQKKAMQFAKESAITKDGRQIEVVANIANLDSAKSAVENGAEGVGLFRTEFLYLERAKMPTEEEQYQVYRNILNVFGKMPVILRTLDVGGDKEIPYMGLEAESNSFLGQRALRLCLTRPDIFKPQIRAALRASAGHNLKIMFPMVAIAEEVRSARKVIEACKKELMEEGKEVADNIEIGIMVEIPSAALVADQLAKEVDFFSIGTNDLSQYTMAADRTNPKVAYLSDAFYPAVLRLCSEVIRAAHKEGKWVGMCGELAGEPLALPILLGMGLDEFSMNPPMIPLAKQIIRNLNTLEMKAISDHVLNLETPAEIKAYIKEEIPLISEITG
ncbi:MAG: phosphoenolpyruvate--protein phosphotransferase [Anaerolineaceae bacterium]|nr:phosphoenolpyruvate--protein phosphotransferase [Anaerolineaceae bacterium]